MFIYLADKNKNRAEVVCHIKWNLRALASVGTELSRGGTGAEEIYGISESGRGPLIGVQRSHELVSYRIYKELPFSGKSSASEGEMMNNAYNQVRHLHHDSLGGLNGRVASNSGGGSTGKNKGSLMLGSEFCCCKRRLESQMLIVL